MAVEVIKMSSKGQIVIPQDIRNSLNADEGSLFAVIKNKDTVILKKIDVPSKEELICDLVQIAREGKDRLQARGIKESDIPEIVHNARKR